MMDGKIITTKGSYRTRMHRMGAYFDHPGCHFPTIYDKVVNF